MKRNIIAVLAIVMVLCCVTLAACNDNKTTDVLDNYICDIDGTTVSADFTLPAKIGGESVEWKSDKENISLQNRGEDWLAKVSFPESGEVEVTLTVSVKNASKSYKVRVKALDVYDFMNNYTFPKDKATVVENFALEREFTYAGKKATIAWSVDQEYELYIKVSEDGNTLEVTPQGTQTEVRVKATFTYGGVSASQSYRMTVYKEMEGLELVNYWYSNTGVSIDMSGYVVEIATEYSESYGNVSLYMVNDEMTAGYYLYRVKLANASDAAKLQPGTHITVTGTTNTNYNGLIETNAGGSLVVDADKPAIDVNTTVYAIDQEILGNLPTTVYNESRLVSLSNWKVKSVAADADKKTGDNFTILTLTKGDVDVALRVSKYMEGAYKTTADDATWTALCGLTTTYPVGTMVNATGILSQYQGAWQILLANASAVTASGKEADAEGTTYQGKQVAEAIKEVNAKLVELNINTEDGKTVRIQEANEFTLPTESGDVTVKYEVVGASNAVVIDGGKMTVTPGNPETTTILATYTVGDFSANQFIFVESLVPTAASMLEDLAIEKKINKTTALPEAPEGATITWEVVEGEDVISIEDGMLIPVVVTKNTPTIIKATITYNEVTRSKEYVVIVQAPDTFNKMALDAAEALEDKAQTADSYIIIGTVSSIKDAYNETYGNVSFYVTDGFYEVLVYRYKLSDAKDIKVGDSIAIAAPMKKYGTDLEAVATFVKLNVTDLATAYKAGQEGTGVDGTTVYGKISNISYDYNPSNNNISLTITDGTTSIDCYKLTGGNGLEVGDYILVTGKPTSYTKSGETIIQFGAGATYVGDGIYIEKPEFATTMKAGTYKFAMDATPAGSRILYATGELDNQGALVTSTDASEAADIIVEAVADKEDVYTLKIDDKYLTGYRNGNYNNMKLVDTVAEAGEWTWNDEIKTFTCTYSYTYTSNDETKTASVTCYFGAYVNSKTGALNKTTMALSETKYVTGKNAGKVGVTQFIGQVIAIAEKSDK